MNKNTNLEDLETFLINHSKINKKFIIDFFGFQKIETYKINAPFVIDLDDVSYWLESRKAHLKDTLLKSYNKLVDYKIINIEPLPPNRKRFINGGQNKEIILLTSECFKMLCLRSKTKKAELVRKYYIELEKLIDNYKNIIIEKLDNKINILENDLRKDVFTSNKYCYIFEETDELGEKYYRLGQSGNIKQRMYNHNSSNVHKKILSFKIKTDNILHFEACLRGIMFDYRYKNNKDYYKISDEKIKSAINHCNTITKEFNNKSSNFTKIGGGNKINVSNIKLSDKLDYKKINTEIKILFSYLSKSVRWNLFDKYTDGYYDGKKMTNKHLQKEILPKTDNNKQLIVDCHRFGLFTESINLGYNKINYETLFKILYKFYNKEELTLEYLIKIPNDMDDYVKDAIHNIKHGNKIYRIDLLGSLCRYENIININDNIYKLVLGS